MQHKRFQWNTMWSNTLINILKVEVNRNSGTWLKSLINYLIRSSSKYSSKPSHIAYQNEGNPNLNQISLIKILKNAPVMFRKMCY